MAPQRRAPDDLGSQMVEPRGLEPLTPCLQSPGLPLARPCLGAPRWNGGWTFVPGHHGVAVLLWGTRTANAYTASFRRALTMTARPSRVTVDPPRDTLP